MKLLIFFISFTYFITLLSAQLGQTLMVNPSNQTIGMGYYTGTAYSWAANPLNAWANPATISDFRGIAYFFSDNKVNPVDNRKAKVSTSYLAFGGNDFGIVIPFINNRDMGTTYSWQKMVGDTLVKPFESVQKVNVAGNMGRMFNIKNDFLYLEPKLGLSYNMVKDFTYYLPNMTKKKKLYFYTFDFGGQIKVDLNLIKHWATELAVGYVRENVSEEKIKNPATNTTYHLPIAERKGIAGKIGLESNCNRKLFMVGHYLCSMDAFALIGTYDIINYRYESDHDINIVSYGAELSLFCLVYLRCGQYKKTISQETETINTLGAGVRFPIYRGVDIYGDFAFHKHPELTYQDTFNVGVGFVF